MKSIVLVGSLAIALSACASVDKPPPPTTTTVDSSTESKTVITYYDRNYDGVVDLEFHDFGCCDRNWALVDTNFTGRYDLNVVWGYALQKTAVDLPVPRRVKISYDKTGMPRW